MTWVRGFIVFLVVGFALFYLVAYPEAAAHAVRAVAGGLAVVFRSILIFFQSLAGYRSACRTASIRAPNLVGGRKAPGPHALWND